jgi:hypothetical protein
VNQLSARTDGEDRLVAAFRGGEPLELKSVRREGDEWVVDRKDENIRHSLIRQLLLSADGNASGETRKLDVTGAYIAGPLDLSFTKVQVPIRFVDCVFDSTVVLSNADLRSLDLQCCMVPEIRARNVVVAGDMNMDGTRVCEAMVLAGARLSHDLSIRNCSVGRRNPESAKDVDSNSDDDARPALDISNAGVTGNIEAEGLEVLGRTDSFLARVGGSVSAKNAVMRAGEGRRAWDSDAMTVEGKIDATGLKATGETRFVDAVVVIAVFNAVCIENSGAGEHGYSMVLDRMACTGSIYLRRANLTGPVKANGANVVGGVYAADASWISGMDLSRTKMGGNLNCRSSRIEKLDLTSARIGGDLRLEAANLGRSPTAGGPGTALNAYRTEVLGDVLLKPAEARGSLELPRAVVNGKVEVEIPGQLSEPLILRARGMAVSRSASVDIRGTVDLRGASVGNKLTIELSRLHGSQGSSTSAVGAAADLTGVKARDLILEGTPPAGFVDVSNAVVGLFNDTPGGRDSAVPARLDGFVYDAIADGSDKPLAYRRNWLRASLDKAPTSPPEPRRSFSWGWRRRQQGQFKPQPYRQLAGVYNRTGNDNDARRILFALQIDHNAMQSWRRVANKAWGYLQCVFVGYGYKPWLALIWVILLAMSGTWWFVVNDPEHRVSIVEAGILSLGFLLPGSGLDRVEQWRGQMGTVGHLWAAGLLVVGLTLGATVVAAVGRVFRR